MAQLGTLRSDFASGRIHPCGAFSVFAQVWTAQHIQGADRLLAEFLKGRATEPSAPALGSQERLISVPTGPQTAH